VTNRPVRLGRRTGPCRTTPRNLRVRFLSDVQDWRVLDKAALDKALQGLPVLMSGQPNVYKRLFIEKIVYDTSIVYDIMLHFVCDIVYAYYDIVYAYEAASGGRERGANRATRTRSAEPDERRP
jgi:hypothetical protein